MWPVEYQRYGQRAVDAPLHKVQVEIERLERPRYRSESESICLWKGCVSSCEIDSEVLCRQNGFLVQYNVWTNGVGSTITPSRLDSKILMMHFKGLTCHIKATKIFHIYFSDCVSQQFVTGFWSRLTSSRSWGSTWWVDFRSLAAACCDEGLREKPLWLSRVLRQFSILNRESQDNFCLQALLGLKLNIAQYSSTRIGSLEDSACDVWGQMPPSALGVLMPAARALFQHGAALASFLLASCGVCGLQSLTRNK